jgi:PAS domain S-box-containing protein
LSSDDDSYRVVFEGAGDGILVLDAQGILLDLNPIAEAMIGRPRAELCGRPVQELLVPEDVVRRPIQWRALAEGRDVLSERLFLRRDGAPVLVEIHSRRLADGRIASVVRDLRGRETTEAALGAVDRALGALTGENFFTGMLSQLCQVLRVDYAFLGARPSDRPQSVHMLALSHRGQPIAPFDYDLAGTPCDEVLGCGLIAFPQGVRALYPADPYLAELEIEGYAGTDLRSADGVALGLLVVMSRTPFADLALVEAVLRQFAVRAGAELERARGEEHLRDREARLRAVASALPDRIFVVDDGGRILEIWSGSSEAPPKLPPAAVGRLLEEALPAPLAAHFRGLAAIAVAAGESDLSEFQVEIDGRTVWLETRAARIGPELVGHRAAVLVARDISERKATEIALSSLQEQFLQAQKMEAVGRLAGGVAHDFNNLLGVIQGYSQLVREGLPAEHPHREDLAEIERAADRGAAVTRRLLAFSRKEVGEPQSIQLAALLSDLRKLLARLMGEDVTVVLETRGEVGTVFVDPAQIEQVVLNLAVNARDAMPEGGRLELAVEEVTVVEADPGIAVDSDLPAGRWARLNVTDNGMGMDPDTQRRMFEPFFTTKPLGKGTGLGLATVYGIVQQARGHIRCRSRVGHGTTFSIYLPIQESAVAAGAESSAAEARPFAAADVTILLVEDEPSLRSVERRWLEAVGFHVLAAGSISEAMAIAADHPAPIDLLLTDVVLPDGNGRGLAEHLQRFRPDLRVLFVSGYAAEFLDHSGSFPAGDGFLPKPYSMQTLLEVVRRRLGAG